MPDYSKLIEAKRWNLENQRPSFAETAVTTMGNVAENIGKSNIEKSKRALEMSIQAKKEKAEFVQKLLTDKGYTVYKVDNQGKEVNPTIDDMVNTYIGVMNKTGLPQGMSIKPVSNMGERNIYKYNKITGQHEKAGTYFGKEDKFIGYGEPTKPAKDTPEDVYAKEEAKLRARERYIQRITEKTSTDKNITQLISAYKTKMQAAENADQEESDKLTYGAQDIMAQIDTELKKKYPDMETTELEEVKRGLWGLGGTGLQPKQSVETGQVSGQNTEYKIGDIITTKTGKVKVVGFYPDGEPDVVQIK
ncbi:MAG: hypothetical protein WC390_08975 [Sulfurimonas sp.]|jgi:hypothetical protein